MKHKKNCCRTRNKEGLSTLLSYTRSMYPGYRRIGSTPFGVLFLFLLLSLTGCSKELDEHYERPSWLEEPIYKVLEEKGNFKMFLQCVDKTLYAQVLKGSGNYTVFAPNDEAFSTFLSKKGYSSVDNIPLSELDKIIGYSLVYNKFEANHLGDVLLAGEWLPGSSMKKRTSYYKTIYKEQIHGKEEWVVDAATEGTYIYTPYKYIPIFTTAYFMANGLNATDYNTFYPNTPFVGLNVLDGQIVNSDVYAENGIIHEISAVPYPLNNLDELLKEDKNKAFKEILDFKIDGVYLFTDYQETKSLTEEYKKIYPDSSIVSLYVKRYPTLSFSPNIEAYLGTSGGTTEQDGYTLFVPSNEAVENFIQTKLLKYTDALTNLPTDVLTNFLHAHMANVLVWPSGFKVGQNVNGEFFNAEGTGGLSFEQSGVTGKTMAGNGLIYNIDHVIKSKYFETVYSEIALNPAYSMLNTAFKNFYSSSLYEDLMKSSITGYMEENYTILIPSDELLVNDGYAYDEIKKTFSNSNLIGSITVDDRLKRLLRMCVFKRIKNNEVDTSIPDFEGSPSLGYEGYGYAVNDYGDMIRFKDNKLQAVGNMLAGEWVEATKIDASLNNGDAFRIDKLLQFSPRTTNPTSTAGWEDQTLYKFISDYTAQNTDASLFKAYLDKTLYNSVDVSIAGISTSGFYTILIPQNDKMEEAIAQGYLPPLANVSTTDIPSLTKASNFISTCFLSGTVLPDDGVERIMPGNYPKMTLSTVYKVSEPSIDLVAEKTYMEVVKENGKLKFIPKNIEAGLTVKVTGINQAGIIRDVKKSNYMGPRAVIHAIDNFLTFEVNIP